MSSEYFKRTCLYLVRLKLNFLEDIYIKFRETKLVEISLLNHVWIHGSLRMQECRDESKMCGSKNYPYLPHERAFSLDCPTSLEIPVKIHTFTEILGPLRTPHTPGISNPFCEGSLDIFWNYTIYNCQPIQLLSNKFIDGILGGTLDLAWLFNFWLDGYGN